MKNIFKKVGSGKNKNMDTRHPYIWIPDIHRLVRKVGMMSLMIFAMAAVWAMMPANGAEAAFSCDTGTVNDTCTITATKTMNTGGETITGTGNLVINAAVNPGASTDISYFNFGGNITINSGGSITTNFQATSTDFTVNSGGSINVTGKGYGGGTGGIVATVQPSNGTGAVSGSEGGAGPYGTMNYGGDGGGGGGHGSSGGKGRGSYGGGAGSGGAAGISYDATTAPVMLGSGGGGGDFGGNSGSGGAGGAGGGVVKIVASGLVTINGYIYADGNIGGNGCAGCGGGGGGSGGSIWIQAGTITGNAAITAKGGSGGAGGYLDANTYGGGGGGGAGGRIAVYYATSTYSGSPSVSLGSIGSGGSGGTASNNGTISISAVSALTAICSVAGNGCTSSGQSASPQQAFNIDSIAGTATSTLGTYSTSTQKVEISIYNASTTLWWNGSSFASTTENWIQATGTTTWSYNTSGIVWNLGTRFDIRSRAYNAYGIVETTPQTLNFIAVNSPPTVSNVTATNTATTTVSVSYDVSDPELGAGNLSWIELFYDSGAALAGSLAQGSTANIALTGDASFLPLSNGTTTIDEEVIAYATRSGNTLSGITRGANSTTDTGHNAGAKVWARAVSATGNVGSTIPTGSGKTIAWNAKTDIDGFYSGTEQIRVVAHDGASQSMIGWATSSAFILDTKNPTAGGAQLLINGSNAIELTSSTILLTVSSGLSDDSQVKIQFSTSSSPYIWYGGKNDGTVDMTVGSAGQATTTGAVLGSWSWDISGGSRAKTVYARVTDAYGNVISSDLSATAEQNALPVVSSVATTTSPTLNSSGLISLTYNLSDPDSSGVTPADTSATTTLMIDLGITLNTAVANTTDTTVITTGINKTVIAANDIIQIDNELMLVSGNSAGTLTVQRGYAGSRAALHSTTGVAAWLAAKGGASNLSGNVCGSAAIVAGACSSVAHGNGKTISWTPASDFSAYYASAKIKVVAIDGRNINQLGNSSDSSAFEFDSVKPTLTMTAGTAATNNIQFTDVDVDGNADSRDVTLRIVGLAEHSSSTQGVYLLFSNNGTHYGTATSSSPSTGDVTESGVWEFVSAGSMANYSKPWTLVSGGSRTKNVYIKVKDVYGNEIATAASSTVVYNKAPQFENVVISDSDQSSFRTATGTGIVLRQCNLYDADPNCGTGKVKLAFRTRDPDANESALATKGSENITYYLSTNGGASFATSSISALITTYATTSVSVTNADASGGYNPVYSTTTVYFNPGVSSGSLIVKVGVTDNEIATANPGVTNGSPVVYATSNTITYDTTAPTNASPRAVEFDAGVAGTVGINNVSIIHSTDSNTTQYLFSAITTDGTASTTPWTTLSGAGPTYLSWGFDTATTSKSVNIKFRDIYGNAQTSTTTASTVMPLDANAFMVQDTSNVKVTPAEYREYISWQASTSTDFASYKLEYATSSAASATGCSGATYGNYNDVTIIYSTSTNYYTHLNLTTGWCYKYRVGVKDVNNNITIRSNAGTIGYPDGLQNAGEGGGGTAISPTASQVTNVVPTQGTNGNVTVNYKLTDSSLSTKVSPSYEGYVFYNIGTYLTASSTNTLTLSDTTKLPLTNGYIQINQEVIGYTGNATSTGILSGITRGTWPTFVSSGRATRTNSVMASSTSVWIMATSTGVAITNTSISSGQNGSLSWNPRTDSRLDGNYLSGVGIRVLAHDNQVASSGPLSSQSDQSVDSTLAILDLKAPVIGTSSLLINGSASSVENASSTAALSLTSVSGDTSSETIYIQFATSSNWFGALSGGTISATSSNWGDAMSVGGNLGPWTWPLTGRSETVSVRMKDAYGNISNTDTNSILKNAVPEFSGSVSDSDASGYATTTNNNIVIRQCNIFDTDPLCTAGKVKVKFLARDADTAQGVVTPGYIHADLSFSLNGGAYATSSVATYSATGTNALVLDAQAGTSTVALDGTTYTTVTAYYDPSIANSATLAARVSVTDNENGTTPVIATSNTVSYDKTAPSGSLTFDAGIAGSSTTAVVTIPAPTDANAVQYRLTDDSATHSSASSTAWTSFASTTSVTWTFDSDIEGKVLNYFFRDVYGNQTGTGTASSLAPTAGSTFAVDDISTGSNKRTYLSWIAATSSNFAMYRLEYATSSQESSNYAAFRDLITIPDSGLNYYTYSGLDQNLWYRYRLSVKNAAGNYSVKTVKNGNSYITAKPDGTLNGDENSANDTTEPTVTNVSAPTILATTATIRFDITDNAASQMSAAVYYAASADYNSTASSTRSRYAYKFGPPGYVSTGSAGSSTTTSVTISGLTKNTLYKYAVEVCDITGNCKFKEQSDGAPYELTTSAGPAIVSGSIVPANSATIATYDTAAITWKTDIGADSQVFYSASTSAGALVNPTTAGSDVQISIPDGNNQYPHSASISSLSSNFTYYYKVRSTDRNSASVSYLQYDESPLRSFTTAAQPVPTMTVAPSCSVTDSTITVNWTTDQDTTTEISVLSADVGVNYFNSTPGAQIAQYPSGTIDNASRLTADYGKTHTNTFTGLTANTTYYLKARSFNRSNGETLGLLSCKTNATPAPETIVIRPPAVDITPPLISVITIKDITANSATIAWGTDEAADSLIKYGTTMSYGSLGGTEKLSVDHEVILGGLQPNTAYNFKAMSADARGNRAYAGDQSFTTLSEKEAAQTTKEELEALQKELKELKEKQESEAKKAQSLAEATKRFKAILKSVASDVSLQDLEDLTTDISDTISDITQEVTPPNIIGGVPQVDVEATTATIKWKTNKESNSIIALVPQQDYDAKAANPYIIQVGQSQEAVKEHTVVIPDLHSSTVYHFQIRSKATVGPEGKSRDFVFETRPELPIIIDYSFKKITENSITVVWRTNTLTSSLVRYTPFSDKSDLLSKESKTQGNPAFVQAHEVTVGNLPSDVAYLIEISSKDISGAEVSKVIGTVRTVIDVKAPAIAKVRSESTLFPGKVEKTQTIIYWETDEPSTSQIFWKEGVAKGDFINSSRLDMEYTTSHVVVMTNFKPGAVYRFQVESTDPAGNKSRSTDYTVLTPKKGETVIDLIINNFQDIFGFLRKM